MKLLLVFLFLTVATATSRSILTGHHLIRSVLPKSDFDDEVVESHCLSWRLSVEINNLRDMNWEVVPEECISYVRDYMTGPQYFYDCFIAVSVAITHAESVELTGDGKDAWILDVDQTILSLIDYYALPTVQYGAIPHNDTMFQEWLAQGVATPNILVRVLYRNLIEMGFKIVFLSESSERLRDARIANLRNAGYNTWEKLILKADSEQGTTEQEYKTKKRTELVREGYRIHGNMGDQWSDLIGDHSGTRTFKLVNPMFYNP